MSDSPTTAELIEAIREGVAFSAGTVMKDDEWIEQGAEVLETNGHPELVTVMVSAAATLDYHGIAGFREALRDWISPYERFRLVIEDVIPRDDKIVFLVRQTGTTKHDGVEVETLSASVWSMLDGQIRQVTYYLDQRTALEAAGIDLDQRRQE